MSASILPIKPGNTSGVNDGLHESLRLSFLTRFLAHPNRFSVCLTVRDYLNSDLSGADNYVYKFVSKVWAKNGAITNVGPAELYILICNFEQNSFCSQIVGVILEDMKWNKETQKAIYDDTNNTQEARDSAWLAYQKFMMMENNLDTYRNTFLTYDIISNEILKTLEVLMHVNE